MRARWAGKMGMERSGTCRELGIGNRKLGFGIGVEWVIRRQVMDVYQFAFGSGYKGVSMVGELCASENARECKNKLGLRNS